MQDNEIYFKIYKWMPNLLGLKGAELEIYAIIYSFSSSGKPFTGSINWICDFIGTNYKTVIKYLKSLTEKGYIIKKDENANNGTTNAYTVNPEFVYVPEKTPAETIPAPETPAEISTDTPTTKENPVNTVVEKFNEICTSLERVDKLSSGMIKNIETLFDMAYTENDFEECFKLVESSKFLTGKKSDFMAEFNWIINPENFSDILSGKFVDGKNSKLNFSEVLKDVGFDFNKISFTPYSEADFKDIADRQTALGIPKKFSKDKIALKEILKFYLGYSCFHTANNKEYQNFENAVISSLVEMSSSNQNINGVSVNCFDVIDTINEIQKISRLDNWLNYFYEKTGQTLKDRPIKNKCAYLKTCIWNSMSDYIEELDQKYADENF